MVRDLADTLPVRHVGPGACWMRETRLKQMMRPNLVGKHLKIRSFVMIGGLTIERRSSRWKGVVHEQKAALQHMYLPIGQNTDHSRLCILLDPCDDEYSSTTIMYSIPVELWS
jgi:hypothetical protein